MIAHSAKWYSIIVQSGHAHANEAKQKSKTIVVYIFVFVLSITSLNYLWHWTIRFLDHANVPENKQPHPDLSHANVEHGQRR